MASLMRQPQPSVWLEPPRVRLEPVRFHQTLLDGSWWPSTGDLAVELPVLVPVLDTVRGPVARLLLSPAGWTARPHHIVAAGRTINVAYLAGQSPSMMIVRCADGGSFTLGVTPPRPGPEGLDSPETGSEKSVGEPLNDAWESEHGGFVPRRNLALR